MVQAKFQMPEKKVKRADTAIALVIAAIGIWALVEGFTLQIALQLDIMGVMIPLISYLIGLALLLWAKKIKAQND